MAKEVIGCVLVVGGIAGIQSALDLAESGYYVYLLERTPSNLFPLKGKKTGARSCDGYKNRLTAFF